MLSALIYRLTPSKNTGAFFHHSTVNALRKKKVAFSTTLMNLGVKRLHSSRKVKHSIKKVEMWFPCFSKRTIKTTYVNGTRKL